MKLLQPAKIPKPNRNFAILTVTISLLCFPVIVDLGLSGNVTPFRYFAGDSFYYFTVARNFAETGKLTFDQTHPTNGFHPLWQILTGLLYKTVLIFGLSEVTFLKMVLLASMILVSLGVLFSGMAVIKARGKLTAVFTLMPVGVYALLILPVWLYYIDYRGFRTSMAGPFPLYGTMWSFMDGMESSLVIFAFGLLFFAFINHTEKAGNNSVLLGLLAAFLVLSRLDHIFIAFGVSLYFIFRALKYRNRRSVVDLLLFTACLAVPIAVYMCFNYTYAHTLMPVSGVAKTTFPRPSSANLYNLILVLKNLFNNKVWLPRFYRIAQIVLPCIAVVATFCLTYRGRGFPRGSSKAQTFKIDDFDKFLLSTGGGVLLLAFYNFFFVARGQGHWYYPVSIMYTALAFISIADRYFKTDMLKPWKIIACTLVCLTVFLFLHRRPAYHEKYSNFYFNEAEALRNYYQSNFPKIIEYDDGIIAFSTGFPAMSGFGYTLDKEAAIQMRKGNLIELALERGFDRVTSLVYLNFAEHTQDASELLKWMTGMDLDFSFDYISPSGNFAIVKIYRK